MSEPAKIKAFPVKAATTMVLLGVFLAVLGLIPGLKWFHGLQPSQVAKLGRMPGRAPLTGETPQETRAVPSVKKPDILPGVKTTKQPELVAPYLFDPSNALRHFYAALERTQRKDTDAVTVILHYGDSPVTADSITADAREILQSRFGNAGHGYLLIAKPWAWYGHRGVDLRGKGWKIEPATQARARDGFHGLGGVSFIGQEGASSTVKLSLDQTGLQVYFLQQPGGGAFTIKAGAQVFPPVQTAGPEKKPGYASFDLPEGTRTIELDVTSGSVRLFGYSFHRNQPGIVYSSLGLNGAQVQAVVRYFEVHHWTEQLQHQHPSLVVFNYGTNESVFPAYIQKQYPGELRQVIERIQTALPEASLLIMSPMDRGQRDISGQIITLPILPKIVEIKKQVALETHCAFYDTFDAMGGAGTMAKWYNSQPRLVSADFTHPLPGGAAKVGALLASALTEAFDNYENRQKRGADQIASTKSNRKNP